MPYVEGESLRDRLNREIQLPVEDALAITRERLACLRTRVRVMIFKPTIWYPIAIGLTVINLVGVGYALRPLEPLHAAIHALLAVAFGLWARRLRQGPRGGEDQARLDVLGAEVASLRQELNETQERLDFAERLLAQRPETRHAGPPR
jgi:signal transduction histidine kinase